MAISAPGIGQKGRFRLGAVLVDNNKVVACGFNQLKTHPQLAMRTPWPFLHAESHAILRYGLDNCEGLDLYVVRIGKKGERRLAKPCSICMYFIEKCGINRVYYSINDDRFGVIYGD